MKRVCDLPANIVAEKAAEVWRDSGSQSAGLKLLYHALSLDPLNATALITLCQVLDKEPTEALVVAVADYAVNHKDLPQADRDKLQRLRTLLLWRRGLTRHKSGSQRPPDDSFQHPSLFELDEEKYRRLISQAVGKTGDIEFCFTAAHNLIGLEAGLLKHKSLGLAVPDEEMYYSDRFEKTSEYAIFLQAESLEMDCP